MTGLRAALQIVSVQRLKGYNSPTYCLYTGSTAVCGCSESQRKDGELSEKLLDVISIHVYIFGIGI